MSLGNLCKIYLYSRYERFWHWLQTVLIIVLLVTGLEVHGVFVLIGFEQAVTMHEVVGISWLIAFAFFVFWLFTTGEWRQYIPTTRKMVAVVCHYGYGIFKGDPHPVPKQKDAKHNPLQRLTYLSLAAVLLPIQMLTGMLYWGYNSWDDWGLSFLSLEAVAFVHMACAFALFVFLVVHVYMTTTGHTPLAHIKAMITGWEEVEEGATIEEWEKKRA
ncbi:MAG: cytochrome b/b6 domain-containing protein [Thermodesulfobacteriota bacterium]|nr:cytochrome b/b6 domain-containing protein [Thermodesulfobacteriota bacterium]